MDVSPNALRKELVVTLNEVNLMLKQQDEEPIDKANRSQLLLAKAECLNGLVGLQGKR